MGDMREDFRAWNDHRREIRARLGQPCRMCVELLPKAQPSLLLPGQVCRIHGYRDPRKDQPQ